MAFNYEEKFLFIEDVNLKDLAAKIGTPFYCYSKKSLVENFNKFKTAFPKADICYAVKANANIAILKILAAAGAGADVVSGGELFLALKCGIHGNKIVFSGVGKTQKDIALAIQNEIKQINIESADELEAVNQTAIRLCMRANIAIRVNPDVDAHTHHKITTGKSENKFGISWPEAFELYKKASQMSGVRIRGIAIHIGSQILSLKPFEQAFKKLAAMIDQLEKEDIILQNIDIGGGLGVVYNYKKDKAIHAKDFAVVVEKHLGRFKKHLILEPGRKIVANAGLLVSSVLYNKKGENKDFLIIDAGMNDFARPALYDAWHEILPVRDWKRPIRKVDVVGPVCESSDTFAKDRPLPVLEPEELIAIMGTGAYGASMGSMYNVRPLTAEVLVDGAKHRIIRKRETYEEMIEDQLDLLHK
jgi:diaminopimelate decarboxylase